jgi:hypothetical protein
MTIDWSLIHINTPYIIHNQRRCPVSSLLLISSVTLCPHAYLPINSTLSQIHQEAPRQDSTHLDLVTVPNLDIEHRSIVFIVVNRKFEEHVIEM